MHLMNQKLPSYLLGKYQLIGTVTFSVLFAVVFLNIYIPFSDTAWFGLGGSEMFRLTLLFGTLSILILVVSRMLMYRSKSVFEMTYLEYIIWSFAEIVIVSYVYTRLTVDNFAPLNCGVLSDVESSSNDDFLYNKATSIPRLSPDSK